MTDMQIYWTFVAPAVMGLFGAFIYGLAVYLDRLGLRQINKKNYIDFEK